MLSCRQTLDTDSAKTPDTDAARHQTLTAESEVVRPDGSPHATTAYPHYPCPVETMTRPSSVNS